MNDTFEIETIDQSAVLRETISNIKNVFLSLSLCRMGTCADFLICLY